MALSPNELIGVIAAVSRALRPAAANPGSAGKEPVPAVPLRKSVTPDFLICLEDGKKLKMLKRHLMHVYEMTPADYRLKWGLSPDYPMVAPNYAALRSRIAKDIGLGRPSSKPRVGPVARLAA